ncbi:MAG: hypothetical protein F6K55_36875 [Moorea sp. SIO4A3]|nr:hypothetical protein [Moorena sp. SIO4A3]
MGIQPELIFPVPCSLFPTAYHSTYKILSIHGSLTTRMLQGILSSKIS